MAHLWFNAEGKHGQEWDAWPLGHSAVRLAGPRPEDASSVEGWGRDDMWVLPAAAEDRWVLVAGLHMRVRVNGLPTAGIRVLEDRDEIRIWSAGGTTYFYSAERLASIESYRGPADAVCPRCQQRFDGSMTAVCCPRCGVWHHETDALGCWTYDQRCAVCSDATRLDGSYRWRPEASWHTLV